MLRIVVRGPVESTTSAFASDLANRIASAAERDKAAIRIAGPAPAPLAKLRGKYRFAIQLQGAEPALLRGALREVADGLKPPSDIQWIVDVDPLDML